MAAVVCGLSLSVTSCKDDDESDDGRVDERTQNVMSTTMTDDETVLAALLQQWTDAEPSELGAGILSKTFEPTVGEVYDDATPYVRTIVVGTVAKADSMAAAMLDPLGIEPQQPSGFSWTNANIGTVSYQHGTGNELGVIKTSVRQLPHLEKIRLVREAGANWGTYDPYYSKGDIVRHKKTNRYYICLNDHAGGDNATWISFDSGEQINSLSTSTCSWSGAGNDFYYKYSDQATAQNVSVWLKEFVLNEENFNSTLRKMRNLSLTAKNQIVPSSSQLRSEFIYSIQQTPNTVILDANEPLGDEADLRINTTNMPNTLIKQTSSKETKTYYPLGMLLAGPLRWSMGFTFDYWVPYFVIVNSKRAQEFEQLILSVESQTTLSESHFKCQRYASNINDGMENVNLYLVAMHWTHDAFEQGNKKYQLLFDFVQHKNKIEGKTVNVNSEADLDWSLRNATAHQLVVKDKGNANSDFETVYRSKESVIDEPVAEEFSGIAHYKSGDVYRDNEGSRWFVVAPSGNEYNEMDKNSNYSYLISFEGIKSVGGACGTNLPTKELALKMMLWLDLYFTNTVPIRDDQELKTRESPWCRVAWNVMQNAGVDIRKLLINVMPLSGRGYAEATHMCCVAYKSEGDKQRILRFYNECVPNADRQSQFYSWLHYYDDNTKTFTNEDMYLQDINSQALVTKYGPTDPYCRQALALNSGGDNVTPRVPRTTADPRAESIGNYFWTNGKFATEARSMWGEPVLFFRVTRVYDNGDTYYSNKTDDGLTLTLVSKTDYSAYDEVDPYFMYSQTSGLELVIGRLLNESYKDLKIDGVKWNVPTWQNDWQ